MAQDSPDLSCRVSALGICSSATIALYYTHSCADFDDVSGPGTAEQLSMQKSDEKGVVVDPFVA
ncbi:hypothetical protein ISF_05391 [Cordyceps fumosorosea ARSEF 2679]|uniref:Uncharacterized protein n=1 Tax=Cordyceps fumosorosea (strain ARSEF 2679) TaxID=1081104 RepID=A0A167U7J1_CORFA|nr:hypothetical protein ISF_05391 [Cordyceps fumosorosea ARSEF 2679]OAA61312.1 hypothetical protein ISF_05391 [Cordyceps fumosorosea ARSEF 2679]